MVIFGAAIYCDYYVASVSSSPVSVTEAGFTRLHTTQSGGCL